jgi:hypothetical protein
MIVNHSPGAVFLAGTASPSGPVGNALFANQQTSEPFDVLRNERLK